MITALDTFLLLLLINRGFRFLEAFIIALPIVIAVCFAVQIHMASPPVASVLAGFVPSVGIVTNREMLYIAIGIMGATVMPHSLYLHSSIVQTRNYSRDDEGRRVAILGHHGWDLRPDARPVRQRRHPGYRRRGIP